MCHWLRSDRYGMAPRVWIFSQLLLLMATAISAAERTEVAVGFELSATEYRVEFRDETLPQLARDAAEALGVLLAEQVRYLRFTADGESPFRLSFRLDRADPSAGPVSDGPGGPQAGPALPDSFQDLVCTGDV